MDLHAGCEPMVYDKKKTKIKWSIVGAVVGIIIAIVLYVHTNWYDTFIRWATGQ